ncbi:MAG: CCA tRNA nucleotidyltransferase, partial [Coriobacteriia bacterium]|nr:CCA tRNA nucleotidyltransferase [Coriobacteriia bacterium]
MDTTTLLASVPEPVLAIGRALHERGRDAVLVGGAVRDALLGVASADWDLVTDAPAGEVRAVAGHTPGVRSLYDVGKRFGTLGIALEGGGTLEVSPYRAEALQAATLDERFAADAALRDFTINAIGVDLATGALLDPVGGRADLAGRVLQAPGDPHERLAEDPLRVIRAARFVAELGFELEAATRDALPGAAPALDRVAVERVREELTRLLVAPFAPRGLEVLHESGALAVVLPEVAALDGVTQPTFHDLDVLAHTIQAVGLAPATPVLRWATLLHDVGKPPTRTV